MHLGVLCNTVFYDYGAMCAQDDAICFMVLQSFSMGCFLFILHWMFKNEGLRHLGWVAYTCLQVASMFSSSSKISFKLLLRRQYGNNHEKRHKMKNGQWPLVIDQLIPQVPITVKYIGMRFLQLTSVFLGGMLTIFLPQRNALNCGFTVSILHDRLDFFLSPPWVGFKLI